MSTGERAWSSEGKVAKKFEFKPLPPGEYIYKLDTSGAKIYAGQGKSPSVAANLMLSVEGRERPAKVMVFFGCSLRPGKDGVTAVERASGLLGFAQSLGETVEAGIVQMPILDKATQELKPTDCLDPRQVKQWIEAHDGMEGKVRLKIRPDQSGTPRNEVDYFVESEAASTDTFEDTNTDLFAAPAPEAEAEAELTEEEVEEEPVVVVRKAPVKVVAVAAKAAKPNGVAKRR
jgi:hypothetical protein